MWFRIASVILAMTQAIIYGGRPAFIPWVVYVGPVVDRVANVLAFLGALWLLCSQVQLHQSFVLICQQRQVCTPSPVSLGLIGNNLRIKIFYS
jgi:hypothetical protein